MADHFKFLKQDFPKIYRDIVLQHKAVNKVLSFCDKDNMYLLFTGMFPDVNGGQGINGELETYFVNYLAEQYGSDAVGRATAYALEDQTTFIGFDVKSKDNQLWSQQNNFEVNDDNQVTNVDENHSNCSENNPINTIATTYYESIDFPADTLEFLKNLHEQVKSSFHVVPLKH